MRGTTQGWGAAPGYGREAEQQVAEGAELRLLTWAAARQRFLLARVRQGIETTFSQFWYKFRMTKR